MINLSRKFSASVVLFLIMLLINSFTPPKKLKYNVMVVNRTELENIFVNISDTILFQVANYKDQEASGSRHIYSLIAYYKKNEKYFRIADNLFVPNTIPYIEIEQGSIGINSFFSNLFLLKSDLASYHPDPKYKYLILYPKKFDEDQDGNVGDLNYVHYIMYYAEKVTDKPTFLNKENKGIIPITQQLNPSPPRNP